MKLSLCITTYNRPELTIKAFEKVYNDPRIDEIVIVDDCSTDQNWNALLNHVQNKREAEGMNCKIDLNRNQVNIGMSRNKARAVELAKNEWCILLDSDNVIGADYIDALYKIIPDEDDQLNPQIIYCPDFARPQFDFRSISGRAFTPMMIAHEIANNDALNMALNCCNYVVNRQKYLEVYKHDPRHKATDTVWFNYNWLKAGNYFYFVPGMQYNHLVHEGSGFMQNAAYNMARAAEVRRLIQQL